MRAHARRGSGAGEAAGEGDALACAISGARSSGRLSSGLHSSVAGSGSLRGPNAKRLPEPFHAAPSGSARGQPFALLDGQPVLSLARSGADNSVLAGQPPKVALPEAAGKHGTASTGALRRPRESDAEGKGIAKEDGGSEGQALPGGRFAALGSETPADASEENAFRCLATRGRCVWKRVLA